MRSKGKKTGFTIIELLTVMSIIIILIAILVPSLNAVRRYAKVVTQKGQLAEITKGIESFCVNNPDFGGYPDSSALDLDGEHYCGAMKLCEAMVGQDGMGFHPDSMFDNMGQDADGNDLYFNRLATLPTPPYSGPVAANLRDRESPYIEGGFAQTASIAELFGTQTTFDPCCPVLCDVFKRTELTNAKGEKLGMPVLYYKADTSKLDHDIDAIGHKYNNGTNIYNYWDNHLLLEVAGATDHPMYDATDTGKSVVFYEDTRNEAVTLLKPHNAASYILISAGWDGLYGTRDDVYNFEKK